MPGIFCCRKSKTVDLAPTTDVQVRTKDDATGENAVTYKKKETHRVTQEFHNPVLEEVEIKGVASTPAANQSVPAKKEEDHSKGNGDSEGVDNSAFHTCTGMVHDRPNVVTCYLRAEETVDLEAEVGEKARKY